MGRGKSSSREVPMGTLSCINCPCGWEMTFKFKDKRLLHRMRKMAERNHLKVCNEATAWAVHTGDKVWVGGKDGDQVIKNELKKENEQENMRKRAEEKVRKEERSR